MPTRFPPPPNASSVNDPQWRDWFYKISLALSNIADSVWGIYGNGTPTPVPNFAEIAQNYMDVGASEEIYVPAGVPGPDSAHVPAWMLRYAANH
jgi:hypothetical protein